MACCVYLAGPPLSMAEDTQRKFSLRNPFMENLIYSVGRRGLSMIQISLSDPHNFKLSISPHGVIRMHGQVLFKLRRQANTPGAEHCTLTFKVYRLLAMSSISRVIEMTTPIQQFSVDILAREKLHELRKKRDCWP